MVGVRMFVDEGLGHSSYVIELGDGTAAILDPPRFPTEHLAAARSLGVSPQWTIDTHSHADYVTGSPSLAVEPGITFIAPAASKLETPHQPVRDEELIDLAEGVTMRASQASAISSPPPKATPLMAATSGFCEESKISMTSRSDASES